MRDKAILAESQVRELFYRYWNGESSVDLAKEYGVSKALVLNIAHRRIWKHLDDLVIPDHTRIKVYDKNKRGLEHHGGPNPSVRH